jgi:hypothetical protein
MGGSIQGAPLTLSTAVTTLAAAGAPLLVLPTGPEGDGKKNQWGSDSEVSPPSCSAG